MLLQQGNLWSHFTVMEHVLDTPNKLPGLGQAGLSSRWLPQWVANARDPDQIIYLEQRWVIEFATVAIFQSPSTSQFAEFLMH